MKCPNCQKEIPDGSKFCTFCGFQIPQVQPTPNAQSQVNSGAAAQQPFNQGTGQPFGQSAGQQPFGQDATQQSQQSFNQGTAQPNQQAFNQGAAQQNQQSFNQNTNQQAFNQQQGFSQPFQASQNNGHVNVDIDTTQISAGAKNYWAYLIHGVKHPSEIDTPFNPYYGLVSLFVGAFIVAMTVMMLEVRSVGGLLSKVDSYTQTNLSGGFAFKLFLAVLVLGIISDFFTFSITHLVTRGFLGDKTSGYMTDMTRYYHISSLGLLVAFVGLVLSFFGIFMAPLVLLCLSFYSIMVSIAFVALIFRAHQTTNFDRVYAYLVGIIIMIILGILLYLLVLSMVGSMGLSELENLL